MSKRRDAAQRQRTRRPGPPHPQHQRLVSHAERSPAATSDSRTPGRPRPCVRCPAPAVYYHLDTGDELCEACGIYIAGQHHGTATLARRQLADAIAELLAIALTREHIEAMADGGLEGVKRPTGPDIANAEDPRPWVGYLLDPIP